MNNLLLFTVHLSCTAFFFSFTCLSLESQRFFSCSLPLLPRSVYYIFITSSLNCSTIVLLIFLTFSDILLLFSYVNYSPFLHSLFTFFIMFSYSIQPRIYFLCYFPPLLYFHLLSRPSPPESQPFSSPPPGLFISLFRIFFLLLST